jgi:site-specific recombinase XerD
VQQKERPTFTLIDVMHARAAHLNVVGSERKLGGQHVNNYVTPRTAPNSAAAHLCVGNGDRGVPGFARTDIDFFARDLEARGRAQATVTRRLCTIAGFYRYAVEEELPENSPAAHVRRPRPETDTLTV